MLRLVLTIAVTLAVALAASIALLEIDMWLHPEDGGDRAFGLAVVGAFDTAIYAWLYAIAVGFAVTRTFPITGWRRIAAATSLLALPPLLIDGVQKYSLFDGSLTRTVEFVAVVLLIPVVASLGVAIAGMASNKSLERAREG
jgi:hypothetical protein